MIELNDVSYFTPEKKIILKNINWRIKSGDNWVLFGRNGSGKTKLLDIISGYLYPSSGIINRFGKRQNDADLREIRKRIGFISSTLKDRIPRQEQLVDVVLSGLSASIGLYEIPEPGENSYAAKLLDITGFSGRINETFGILSDGEKQKILMARAMINDPDLLILDEPAMGLDLKAREDLFAALEKLNTLNETAIIYVTHHPDEIISIFDKILILHEGEIFFQGKISEGISEKHLGKLFQSKINLKIIDNRYYCRLV